METYLYNCCKNLLDFFDCLDLSCLKKYYKKDKCDLYHLDDVDHDDDHLNDADDEKSDDSDYDDWVIKNRHYKT